MAGALFSYGRQVFNNVAKEGGLSVNALTNIDWHDVAGMAAVGGAAGALIGSGVGATAGIGLIASSAGVGMAGSAAGYALTAGDSYNTDAMIGNAIIGGITGAATGYVSSLGAGFSGKLLEAEISMLGGEVQMMVSDQYFDNEWSTSRDLAGGTFAGGSGYLIGELASGSIPGLGPLVSNLIRSSAVEAYSNKMQEGIDRMDNSDWSEHHRRER
jgi:hypothetical protein